MPAIIPPQEDEDNILMKLIKALRGNQTPEELGNEISNRAPQRVLHKVGEAAKGAVDTAAEVMSREVPQQSPEELGDAIKKGNSPIQDLLMGRGQSHAKPMIPMPNAPRDISKLNDNKPAPSNFTAAMLGQDPRKDPIPGQEQMSKVNGALRLPPVQAPEPMSYKDVGKMPDPMGDPKGLIPGDTTREAFTKETPTDMHYMDTPGSMNMPDEDIPAPSTDMSTDMGAEKSPMPESAQPFAQQPPSMPSMPDPEQNPEDPRAKLKAYLDRMNMSSAGDRRSDQLHARTYDSMRRDTDTQNSKLGLYALLNQSANMIGNVNGQVASTAPIEGQISRLQAQNNESSNQLMKQKDSNTSLLKKAQDDKLRGMMFMAKQKQDEEKYNQDLGLRKDTLNALTDYRGKSLGIQDKRNELDSGYKNDMLKATQGNAAATQQYRQDMLDLRKSPSPMNDLQKAQAEKARAEAAKAIRDAKLPPKAAQDPVTKEMLSKLSKDTATGMTAQSNFEGFLKAYDSAPTEAAKINFVRANLKTLQSMEGPDAINGTDEPRLMGYLNQVRPAAMFQDGDHVFGTNLPAFRDDIQRRIDVINSKISGNQAKIKKIQAEGGGADVSGHGGVTPSETLAPGMKWQVNTKTGARRQVPQ